MKVCSGLSALIRTVGNASTPACLNRKAYTGIRTPGGREARPYGAPP